MTADDIARQMTNKLNQMEACINSVRTALRVREHGPLLAPVTQVLATDVIVLIDLAARLDTLAEIEEQT